MNSITQKGTTNVRPNLYQQARPELIAALREYAKKYPQSAINAAQHLKSIYYVGDLNHRTVMTLHDACRTATQPVDFSIVCPYDLFEATTPVLF